MNSATRLYIMGVRDPVTLAMASLPTYEWDPVTAARTMGDDAPLFLVDRIPNDYVVDLTGRNLRYAVSRRSYVPTPDDVLYVMDRLNTIDGEGDYYAILNKYLYLHDMTEIEFLEQHDPDGERLRRIDMIMGYGGGDIACINEYSLTGEPVNEVLPDLIFHHDGYCFTVADMYGMLTNNIRLNPYTRSPIDLREITETLEGLALDGFPISKISGFDEVPGPTLEVFDSLVQESDVDIDLALLYARYPEATITIMTLDDMYPILYRDGTLELTSWDPSLTPSEDVDNVLDIMRHHPNEAYVRSYLENMGFNIE